MGIRAFLVIVLLVTGGVVFGVLPSAEGGERFRDGHWRLELSNTAGFREGGHERQGDVLTNLIAEYEVPLSGRFTVGLRLLPIFLYSQGSSSDSPFYGAGFGVASRVYRVKNERRGLFAEIEGHVIAHKNKLRGNSGGVNFLVGAGIGYKFKSDWHTVLKIEHLSNAGLAKHNKGVNLLGLGFGYTF